MIQMRSYPATFHGFKVSFQGPANVEDVEKLAGQGACIEAYMTQYSYERARKVYEKVVAKIEAQTGLKREYHTKAGVRDKEKEIVIWDETEQEFARRAIKEGKLTEAEHEAFVNEANSEVNNGEYEFDPTSQRKPAAQFYQLADDALLRITNKTKNGAGVEASQAQLEGYFESKLGSPFSSMFGEFNRDNVARALKAVEEAESRRKADKLFS